MLALLLAATLAGPPAPIPMKVGETLFIDVFRPSLMSYGGYFRSENLRVAEVGGQFPVVGKRSRARVIALRPGRTEVLLTYVCGMSVCDTRVATVIVSPAPAPPTRRRSTRH